MGKLTSADVQELSWFFSQQAPPLPGAVVAAQTYEPRGSGGYDPYSDQRLAQLVLGSNSSVARHYARVSRVFAVTLERFGAQVRDTLRLAYGCHAVLSLDTREFRFPDVSVTTKTAIERGTRLAIEVEHARLLETTLTDARVSGLSPIACAVRVLEADMRLQLAGGPKVPPDAVFVGVVTALQRATKNRDDAFLAAVKDETMELIEAAAEAYLSVRRELGATMKKEKESRQQKRAALLDDLLGRKSRRESDRLAARTGLRRGSE